MSPSSQSSQFASKRSESVEYFTIITSVKIMFPAIGASDLTDPITSRTLSPGVVRLELFRKEAPDEGLREWAHVAVYGPRRLKSGELGQEISSFHWQHARVRHSLSDQGVERPEWLTAALADQMPGGWNLALVELPGGAA